MRHNGVVPRLNTAEREAPRVIVRMLPGGPEIASREDSPWQEPLAGALPAETEIA